MRRWKPAPAGLIFYFCNYTIYCSILLFPHSHLFSQSLFYPRMTLCARRGCSEPAFIEPRTQIAHKYCGRSHALEVEGWRVQVPHGDCHTCNLDGCHKRIAFNSATGRVHDFCCKDHAATAIAHGRWAVPVRDQYRGTRQKVIDLCSMPGCPAPVFCDGSARRYDYCGRSHAVEHRLNPFTSVSASLSLATSSGTTRSGGRSASSFSHTASGLRNTHLFSSSSSSSSSSSYMQEESTNTFDNESGPHRHNSVHATSLSAPFDPPTAPFISMASSLGSSLKDAHAANRHTAFSFSSAKSSFPASIFNMAQHGASVSAPTPTVAPALVPAPAPAFGPICVVCQEINADVILIPCGHVCLCKRDSELMKQENKLANCPCCRQAVDSTHEVFFNH